MKLLAVTLVGMVITGCSGAYAAGYNYSTDSAQESVTEIAADAILTGPNGMTLYTFDKDSAGVSDCYGGCAGSWPPYFAETDTPAPGEGFTIISRTDGTHQWAKDGAPLYFWAGDVAPGDTNGDGVGGVWHIAE